MLSLYKSARLIRLWSQFKQLAQSLIHWIQNHRLLSICIATIVCISTYDTYLVVLFRSTILLDERNPICQALIEHDPENLSWFIGGKIIGNLVVTTTLILLCRCHYRHYKAVALAVAAFQIGLTIYLGFSDPKTGFIHFDGLHSNDPLVFRKSVDLLVMHLFALVIAALGLAITFCHLQLARQIQKGNQIRIPKRFHGLLR